MTARRPSAPVDFEQPTMGCPRCRREYPDFDGFGVLYCPKPDGCGYCQHMSRSGDDTGWVCDYCGEVEGCDWRAPEPGRRAVE